MYTVTKTYGAEQGLSATFRQWRATHTHCRFLHGYALGFELTIACDDDNLDERNWVYNFGGFKPFKAWLQDTFDHKTVVAEDDPMLGWFKALADPEGTHLQHSLPLINFGDSSLIQLVVVEAVGCEKFAKMAYDKMQELIDADSADKHRVKLLSVKCFEHAGNAATYHGSDFRGSL